MEENSNWKTGVIVLAVLFCVALLCILLLISLWCYMKRKTGKYNIGPTGLKGKFSYLNLWSSCCFLAAAFFFLPNVVIVTKQKTKNRSTDQQWTISIKWSARLFICAWVRNKSWYDSVEFPILFKNAGLKTGTKSSVSRQKEKESFKRTLNIFKHFTVPDSTFWTELNIRKMAQTSVN